jgi:NADH dehydrogenase (ubiquinone) Fe-S protein 3
MFKMKKNFNIIPKIVIQTINEEKVLVVTPKNLILSLKILKQHINFRYNLLSCISGVDFIGNSYRFGVVYELLSMSLNDRIRLKTFIQETSSVPSCVNIFENANWWEREVWDFFGIYFENHPDLRRILTDYGFEGFPLRKDFPLSGFVELRYNEVKKQIVIEPMNLSQENRNFSFEISW